MNKRGIYKYLIPFAILFVVLAVVLYFFHPLMPLFLLASLVIQVPIIWLVTKFSAVGSYEERADRRREAYEKDKDAQAWLGGEEKETRSIGYKNWSKTGHARSCLNRVEPLLLLGRREEAAELLATLAPDKLKPLERKRYDALAEKLAAEEETE